jgi:hypothetical protein
MPPLRLPSARPTKYEHAKPHRPSHLARRLNPPPLRPGPPDLTWFAYIGLALAVVVVILVVPYLISYVVSIVTP